MKFGPGNKLSKPHIWSLSIIFKFSGRQSQSQQKLAKKIIHFIIKFRSKSSTHFTKNSSLNIIKNILVQNSQKIFLGGVRKNICIALFLDAQ